MEGHGSTNECYTTLKEAKAKCLAASDCYAIATQTNICGGKFRVSHGGPTFIQADSNPSVTFRSWELYCSTGNEN